MIEVVALLVVLAVSIILFTPQSSQVEGDELKVRTWLLTFRFDLQQATEIKAISSHQLRQSFTVRLFGAGWPLKPFGWFRNSQLGIFLNLVNDPSKMYLVRLPHRNLLVSPVDGMKETAAA